jgi:hypothetical protein
VSPGAGIGTLGPRIYLASDESAWTTGEFIVLAGGHR